MQEKDQIKIPSIVDSVYVAYEGKLIHGFTFDKRKFPIWLDLANAIEGFREGVSELKTGCIMRNQMELLNINHLGLEYLSFLLE